MSPDLAAELEQEIQREKTEALIEYRRLLLVEELRREDRERLKIAMRTLGKKPQELRQDAMVITNLGVLQRKIEERAAPEVQERRKAALYAKTEHEEETRRLMDSRNAEWSALQKTFVDLDRFINEVRDLQQQVQDVKNKNPVLLGLRVVPVMAAGNRVGEKAIDPDDDE